MSATLRIALLGYGTVGQAVAAALQREHDRLRSVGVSVTCHAALVRDPSKPRLGPAVPCRRRAARVLAGADLVVEALGGVEPAYALVRSALEAGTPVVTANKTLVAHHGPELRALAAARGTTLAFDAAVLAGVPFIGALARRPLIGSPVRLAGIVNGTSHYVADAIARGRSSAEALGEAVERGYAEPDSRADIGGRDAAEKLAILLQLAGLAVGPSDLPVTGLDAIDDGDYAAAAAVGLVIKPIALAALDPDSSGAWVGPAAVARAHPLAAIGGVENMLRLTDEHGQVVSFSGPGAGPVATARTIVDDIVEVVTHGRRASFHAPGRRPPALDAPPAGPWFVRFDDTASLDDTTVASRLAAAGLPALRVAAHDGRIVVRTTPGAFCAVTRAVAAVRSPARALVLPLIDQPTTF